MKDVSGFVMAGVVHIGGYPVIEYSHFKPLDTDSPTKDSGIVKDRRCIGVEFVTSGTYSVIFKGFKKFVTSKANPHF